MPNILYAMLGFGALYAFVGLDDMPSDYDVAKEAERIYCENVVMWHNNNYGHPDYQGIFESVCKPEYNL